MGSKTIVNEGIFHLTVYQSEEDGKWLIKYAYFEDGSEFSMDVETFRQTQKKFSKVEQAIDFIREDLFSFSSLKIIFASGLTFVCEDNV